METTPMHVRRGRRAAWMLGAWLALLAGSPAWPAEYPVRPRPQCPYPPDADPRKGPRGPACLGPAYGARPAPRRHAGRQQWRMRFCQSQARQQALAGAQRAEFLRHCLHRGR